MSVINHLMMYNGKEIDLEALARPKLPNPDEYPTWKYHKLPIPLSKEDHGMKDFEGQIRVVYEIQRANDKDKATWKFDYAENKTHKSVRKSIRDRVERRRAAKRAAN